MKFYEDSHVIIYYRKYVGGIITHIPDNFVISFEGRAKINVF